MRPCKQLSRNQTSPNQSAVPGRALSIHKDACRCARANDSSCTTRPLPESLCTASLAHAAAVTVRTPALSSTIFNIFVPQSVLARLQSIPPIRLAAAIEMAAILHHQESGLDPWTQPSPSPRPHTPQSISHFPHPQHHRLARRCVHNPRITSPMRQHISALGMHNPRCTLPVLSHLLLLPSLISTEMAPCPFPRSAVVLLLCFHKISIDITVSPSPFPRIALLACKSRTRYRPRYRRIEHDPPRKLSSCVYFRPSSRRGPRLWDLISRFDEGARHFRDVFSLCRS
jgi:hypothetical protein